MSALPRYAPMLAMPAPLPDDDDDRWLFEIKFDGIRAIAYVEESLHLVSRNGADITAAWPELTGLAPASPGFVVDGEIVVFVDGRPSFDAIQPRIHRRNPAAVQALSRSTPAVYCIFDILHIGNHPLIDLPLQQRRELLESVGLRGRHWQISPLLHGRGSDVLARSAQLQIEGLLVKRRDGRYLPGRRSRLWTKVKNLNHQEAVIVGWRVAPGTQYIRSLLMAVPDVTGSLVYVGSVSSGLSVSTVRMLRKRLIPLRRDSPPPVSGLSPSADVVWLEPEVVAEIAFAEWTAEQQLRHPRWRGLRVDLARRDIGPRDLGG